MKNRITLVELMDEEGHADFDIWDVENFSEVVSNPEIKHLTFDPERARNYETEDGKKSIKKIIKVKCIENFPISSLTWEYLPGDGSLTFAQLQNILLKCNTEMYIKRLYHGIYKITMAV